MCRSDAAATEQTPVTDLAIDMASVPLSGTPTAGWTYVHLCIRKQGAAVLYAHSPTLYMTCFPAETHLEVLSQAWVTITYRSHEIAS